ncbi:hypothetical protein JCM24511_02358 [Saitozyma sp. JCM 24511]|nr:hypothetical protein JCM24511_02358 [Saitozyma sp. JCM 24511]
MLPPPKRKLPTSSTSKSSSLAVNKSMATRPAAPAPAPKPVLPSAGREVDDENDDEDEELDLSNGTDTGMLMPASVARGKLKAAKQDEGLDLFGLASAPAPAPSASSSKPSLPRPTEITSAPAVADFVPPPPTAQDPYPGYYQLPNGGWAAYDPDYYHSFFPSQSDVQGAGASAGEEQDDGRLGKHWDELKGREGEVMEFDPTRGIREAREEEERRSKVIKPRMLGDDHEYKEIGQVKGLAAERHQLTSLLSTAYTQRDALEERLQANKKSMRVARTKYGAYLDIVSVIRLFQTGEL